MKSRTTPSKYDPGEDWLVYVLVSSSCNKTYVGIGRDPARRLRQHNGIRPGGARSTRAGRPWEIAATYGPYPDRSKAQRVEARLKKIPGLRRLELSAHELEEEA